MKTTQQLLAAFTAPAARRWAVPLALALLFGGLSAYKIRRVTSLPYYEPDKPSCFYWTEAAFHYRHARMIAEGDGVPARDPLIQYPTGIRTFHHFTVFMEYPAAWCYRLLRRFADLSFHAFLVRFTAAWTSVAILLFFLMARQTGFAPGPSLLLTALFAVTPYSFGRVVIGTYLREHWALPFVMLQMGATLALLRQWRWRTALAAAAGSFVALGSWHMSRSVLLVEAVALTALWLWTANPAVVRAMGAWAAGAALAGLVFPVLRTNALLIDPLMLLAYAMLGAAALERRPVRHGKAWIRLPLTFGLLACLLLIVRLLRPDATFAHVRDLILAKLLNFGVKPADPAALSYEARSMWVSSFMSPGPRMIGLMLQCSLPLGAVGLGARLLAWRSRPLSPTERLAVALTGMYFLLFLLIVRLAFFAGLFLTICAGFLIQPPFRYRRLAGAVVAAAILTQGAWLPRLGIAKEQKMLEQRKMLVEWVKKNTPSDAGFLATVGMGSTLSTYANRPIILHSKYENLDVRRRVRGLLDTLYGTPESFLEYCRRYKVRYFIYETAMLTDHTLYSDRYTANAMKLPRTATAYRCHFAPDTLPGLQLVYQHSYFRVFRVLPPGEKPAPVPLRFHPIYHEPLLGQAPDAKDLDDDALDALYKNIVAAQDAYEQAKQLLKAGDPAAAETALQRSLQACRLYTPALLELARLNAERGDRRNAGRLVDRVLAIDPHNPKALLFRGNLRSAAGDFAGAAQAYEQVLARQPDYASALRNLGVIYCQNLKNQGRGAPYIQRYLELEPNDPQREALEHMAGLPPQ